MIKSKAEYRYYLKEDKKALKISPRLSHFMVQLFVPNYIWIFQKKLRKLEYYKNCRKDVFGKIYYIFLKLRFRKYSLKLGFSIPENVFGPGLSILHYGTIVVNAHSKVGRNCKIHACTNIGQSGGSIKAPQLGDNIYIAPGVKIYGDIKLASNIAIAANSSVNKTFEESGILIAGSPAKRIKNIDIEKLIPNSIIY